MSLQMRVGDTTMEIALQFLMSYSLSYNKMLKYMKSLVRNIFFYYDRTPTFGK